MKITKKNTIQDNQSKIYFQTLTTYQITTKKNSSFFFFRILYNGVLSVLILRKTPIYITLVYAENEHFMRCDFVVYLFLLAGFKN